MADYRDWCGSCNQEINFGRHDPDCDYMHAQRIAYKEEAEFRKALFEEYHNKSDEEIFAEAAELDAEIKALSNGLSAKERKWNFITRDILGFDRREELAKRLNRRYL